jgi:hypothetical protein
LLPGLFIKKKHFLNEPANFAAVTANLHAQCFFVRLYFLPTVSANTHYDALGCSEFQCKQSCFEISSTSPNCHAVAADCQVLG